MAALVEVDSEVVMASRGVVLVGAALGTASVAVFVAWVEVASPARSAVRGVLP